VPAAESVLLNPLRAVVCSAAMAPLERQPSYGSTAKPPARDRTEMACPIAHPFENYEIATRSCGTRMR
jgi:hypothetical protein